MDLGSCLLCFNENKKYTNVGKKFKTFRLIWQLIHAMSIILIDDCQNLSGLFGEASGILDNARIYSAEVTLWVFLSQVLSVDHGCVSAVASLICFRIARGIRTLQCKKAQWPVPYRKNPEASNRAGRRCKSEASDRSGDWYGLGCIFRSVRVVRVLDFMIPCRKCDLAEQS